MGVPEGLPSRTRRAVEEFVSEAVEALGENLRSVILYGSAVRGEFLPGRSDVNLLVVLKDASPEALSKVAPAVRRAVSKDVLPVLLSERDLLRSTDVFPIEHMDLAEGRAVIYGEDVLADLKVKPEDLRRQLEFEARAKLIRLRQSYVRDLGSPRGLLELAGRSLASLLPLFKAALKLVGKEVPKRRAEVIKAACEAFLLDEEALLWALSALSGGAKKREAPSMFPRYLRAVEGFVKFLDTWKGG